MDVIGSVKPNRMVPFVSRKILFLLPLASVRFFVNCECDIALECVFRRF